MRIEDHSRARQIELGRSLADRRKIYLDACFWIPLRDASLGVRNDAPALKLLQHLRRGVSNGQLVCPISAAMFLELMKQPYTPSRRIGTAELIDELSLGVAMIPSWIVMGTEVCAFLLKAKGEVGLHSMQELIWTKVACVLGDTYPSLPQLSSAEELALQKLYFDHLWNYSLKDIVMTIGDHLWPPDRFAELSEETNEQNVQHKHELGSFAQTYDVELRGVVEIAGDVAADIIHEFIEHDASREFSPKSDERASSVKMCRNLLYHALKKSEAKDVLRSLHIGASIHASMRWDKQRKFEPNDYYDFEHATAALSYCDAFLTDDPIRVLVTKGQLDLEAVNGCRVFSDAEKAVDYVTQLMSSG